jgi:hypothetical protein
MQELILSAQKTVEGRRALAGLRGLSIPGRPDRLNTGELARKMIPVEQLPPGASPIYDREPLRKCEECESIFGHEPDCQSGLMEDIHES